MIIVLGPESVLFKTMTKTVKRINRSIGLFYFFKSKFGTQELSNG